MTRLSLSIYLYLVACALCARALGSDFTGAVRVPPSPHSNAGGAGKIPSARSRAGQVRTLDVAKESWSIQIERRTGIANIPTGANLFNSGGVEGHAPEPYGHCATSSQCCQGLESRRGSRYQARPAVETIPTPNDQRMPTPVTVRRSSPVRFVSLLSEVGVCEAGSQTNRVGTAHPDPERFLARNQYVATGQSADLSPTAMRSVAGKAGNAISVGSPMLGSDISTVLQNSPPWGSLISALATIESGGNPKAVGKRGELGLYQFSRAGWQQSCRLLGCRHAHKAAHVERTARTHAAALWLSLESRLSSALKRKPAPAEIYCAFNLGFAGFRVRRFQLSRVPWVTRDAAFRFENLCKYKSKTVLPQ